MPGIAIEGADPNCIPCNCPGGADWGCWGCMKLEILINFVIKILHTQKYILKITKANQALNNRQAIKKERGRKLIKKYSKHSKHTFVPNAKIPWGVEERLVAPNWKFSCSFKIMINNKN